MAFPIVHGMTLASNSYVENLVIESLSADPASLEVGRVYYNTTTNQYSMIVDVSGTATVKTFGTKEALDQFIADLLATTGATKVGYAGLTGANGQLTVAQGTVKAALDAIATAIDTDRQDEIDERAALANSATGGGLVGVNATSGANGDFSTTAGTLQAVLDSIVTALDAEINARQALEAGSTDTYLDKVTTSAQSVVGEVTFGSTVTVQGNLLVSGNTVTTLSEIVQIQDATLELNTDLKGASLIVNGEFLTDTDWAKGAVWAIATEKASIDGSQATASSISQAINVTDTQVYEVSFQVLDYVAGNVRVLVDGVEVIANQTANGTYSAFYTATATASVSVTVEADPDFNGSIDNVAVSPVYAPTENSGITVNRGVEGKLDIIRFNETTDLVEIAVWDAENGVFNMEEVGSKPYIDAVDVVLQTAITGFINVTGLQEDGSLVWTTYDSNTMARDISGETTLIAAIEALNNELKIGGGDVTTALQTELDTTQTGAGLSATGTYVAYPTYNETTEPTGAHYIDDATSLSDATKQLDEQSYLNATAITNNYTTLNTKIDTEITDRGTAVSGVQQELDTSQASIGISTTGAYVPHTAYSDPDNLGGVHFINTATTLHGADKILDIALQQEIDDRVAAVSAEAGTRSTNDVKLADAVGVSNTDFTTMSWVAFDSNTQAINLTTYTNVVDALEALNVEMKSGGGDVTTALQTELDATQTSLFGASNFTDGVWSAYSTGVTYIGSATSINDATRLLDVQAKANADAISAEATARGDQDDVIEASVGLNADGTLAAFETYNVTTAPLGQHYIDGETTVRAALIELDATAKAEETARTNADTAIKNSINNQRFTYKSTVPALTHVITHSLATEFVQVTVLVQGDDTLYRNDYVLVTENSNNELTINMTESRNIKVVVQAMDDI